MTGRKEGGAAAKDGIEITPAIIEAGEFVLGSTFGNAVNVYWDARDLAVEVYRAMASEAT